MSTRMIRSMLFLGAMVMASPVMAVPQRPTVPPVTRRAPPVRPVRRVPPPAAPVAPAEPELVPTSAFDLQNTLRRLRIYVMNAPDGARSFGNLGAGPQLWVLLPSCRPQDPNDPRSSCPIGRLEVTPVHGGAVRSGELTTVMAGEVPRRVQAFVFDEATRLVRIRLFTRDDQTDYEAVLEVSQLRYLSAPIGTENGERFEFDFSNYPAR